MLLFVCHANICRSPMAERLARLEWGDAVTAMATASAGTHARAGDAMHPGTAEVLRELGADADGFSSRPLSGDLLHLADVVLTATRAQRAHCARLAPATIGRTFTIRQFGRLSAAVAGATPRATPVAVPVLLRRITAVRSRLQPVTATEDDLADPVNGSPADLRACAEQIQQSLRPALALLSPE
jgi:protein-tyrosine phosphatase